MVVNRYFLPPCLVIFAFPCHEWRRDLSPNNEFKCDFFARAYITSCGIARNRLNYRMHGSIWRPGTDFFRRRVIGIKDAFQNVPFLVFTFGTCRPRGIGSDGY